MKTEDWELMGLAEDKATGADIHSVKGIIGCLSGMLSHSKEIQKTHSNHIESLRKCLQLYVNGMNITSAKKQAGFS